MLTSPTDYMNEVKAKKQVVGTWGYNSHMDFTKTSSEETNVWFFEQVFNFLRAFFGLVMPDNMEVITHNAAKHIKKTNLDQQTFLDELMLVMKGLKEPIWTLRLNLNIVGFIRSNVDPDNPVRIQIQEPSSFIVWGGPDESGFQNFSISYNLFSEGSLGGSDEMLWSVNQPLLEKGLRKWEMQTGHMIEAVQSNAGAKGGKASRKGFQRPSRRRRPMSRGRGAADPLQASGGSEGAAPARPSRPRRRNAPPPPPVRGSRAKAPEGKGPEGKGPEVPLDLGFGDDDDKDKDPNPTKKRRIRRPGPGKK